MEVKKILSIAATLVVLLSLGQAVMADEDQQPLWHANVTAEVHGTPANLVWPFFADFCNYYKIFPLTVSFCVGGVPGRVGQLRYITTIVASPLDGNATYVRWEKHKLTAIDPVERSLSFEVVENNFGMKRVRATMSVSPRDYGCLLTWTYTMDPFPGYTYETFRQLFWSIYQRAARKMEDASINVE